MIDVGRVGEFQMMQAVKVRTVAKLGSVRWAGTGLGDQAIAKEFINQGI